jgi:hypothetical protein
MYSGARNDWREDMTSIRIVFAFFSDIVRMGLLARLGIGGGGDIWRHFTSQFDI